MADGLHFLHSQANQIHRGISPEAICITAGGAWKLAGFGFAMLAEFGNSNPAEATFDYSDSSNCLAQALRVVYMSVLPFFSQRATYHVDVCITCLFRTVRETQNACSITFSSHATDANHIARHDRLTMKLYDTAITDLLLTVKLRRSLLFLTPPQSWWGAPSRALVASSQLQTSSLWVSHVLSF